MVGGSVRAGVSRRLVAVDWAMAETALSLGHAPVAIAELIQFRKTTACVVPPGCADLGLRGGPNFEALQMLAPDLVLSSNFYGFIGPQLGRIAPVLVPDLFVPGSAVLPRLRAAQTALARAVGDQDADQALATQTEAEFSQLAAQVASYAATPVCVVTIGDARHVQIFGADSLYGGVVDRLGLRNIWREHTQFGFNAPVPIDRLLDFAPARLLVVGEVPPSVAKGLSQNIFWSRLPQVTSGQVTWISPSNPYGGMASALRFARALVAGVIQ
ncbi:amino acid ABC transporter substrate-binding protein [Thioclava sp. SK-1]|uniref:ABC transporter substrate-binding protein n=1 Tax=Thioclava sp. SK-1 TaxID=1889770 RepID=UPI0008253C8B|nr:ABC transporter substrate-binding protein [Thioclava sp. SK-1]OCX66586.1 amino acid ABC transporter substrate-binding protein [Thioclava sp. SK-1]